MPRRLSLQLLIATCCKLLLNIGRRFLYPFAPALSRGLGVELTAITSIIALCQFSSIWGVFCGPLADRLGYRRLMLAGLALLLLGLLLCGFFPFYWILLLGLVLANFGKTVFDPALQAHIGQYVPYGSRARAIGITEMSWSASTLVGIPLLGISFSYLGINHSFLLLAVFGLLAWIALFRIFPAEKKDEEHAIFPASSSVCRSNAFLEMWENLCGLLRSRKSVAMLIFAFFVSAANDTLFVSYGVWFEHDFHVSLMSLGFSTVAIGCAELTGESATAFLSDRFGLNNALFTGLVLVVFFYGVLPFLGQTLVGAMAGLFCLFCFFEFIMVTSFSLCTELVPSARATMMAGFFGVAGIGRTLGVLWAPWLWRIGGINAISWTAGAVTVLALLALIWGVKGRGHHGK